MYVFCSLDFVKKKNPICQICIFFCSTVLPNLAFLRRSVEVWHKKSPISHRNPKKLVDGQQQKFCHGENCHLSKDCCIFTRGVPYGYNWGCWELLCLNADSDWDIYRYCCFWVANFCFFFSFFFVHLIL